MSVSQKFQLINPHLVLEASLLSTGSSTPDAREKENSLARDNSLGKQASLGYPINSCVSM